LQSLTRQNSESLLKLARRTYSISIQIKHYFYNSEGIQQGYKQNVMEGQKFWNQLTRKTFSMCEGKKLNANEFYRESVIIK